MKNLRNKIDYYSYLTESDYRGLDLEFRIRHYINCDILMDRYLLAETWKK